MAATPNTLSTSEYWMSPDALTIDLNAFDNPQYLQVSLLAGSVITAYRQDVIDYDTSLNYRKWTLQAYNNFFDRTDRAYVYAQLEKEGNTALIIYSYDILELAGTVTDSSGNSFDVYNIFLATISPSVNISGESIMRTWETAFDTGSLNTDKNRNEEQLGEWAKMFRLNKVTDMIEVLKDITEAVIHRLKIGARKILITDVFTSSEEDISRRTDDQSVPTTKFLQDFTDSRFLSKIKEDKTEYLLRLLGGILSPYIQSPDFVTGPMGAGFTLKQNADGQSYAEVDKLLVRMKAVFQTLSIMETELAGAAFMFNSSGARATITKVERIDKVPFYYSGKSAKYYSNGKRAYVQPSSQGAVYRCYFLSDDGEKAIENKFRPGNLVRSQSFNIKAGVYENVSNHYWWRLVTGVGDNWVDISVDHCDSDSDIPKEGDVMVQFGDISDVDYQNAIILSAYGDGAPYLTMYQGINSYSLSEKDVFTIGYDRVTQECYVKVFGRFYVGDRDENNYLIYSKSKGLRIKAEEILLSSGKSVVEVAKDEINIELEYAGINVKEKTVTVRAESFFVTDTAGFPIAIFTTDEKGRPLLKAEYIDVENLKVKHLDGADGTFSGNVSIANKIFLNSDGSGSLANGNIVWDSSGNLNMTYSFKIERDGYILKMDPEFAEYRIDDTQGRNLVNLSPYTDVPGYTSPLLRLIHPNRIQEAWLSTEQLWLGDPNGEFSTIGTGGIQFRKNGEVYDGYTGKVSIPYDEMHNQNFYFKGGILYKAAVELK